MTPARTPRGFVKLTLPRPALVIGPVEGDSEVSTRYPAARSLLWTPDGDEVGARVEVLTITGRARRNRRFVVELWIVYPSAASLRPGPDAATHEPLPAVRVIGEARLRCARCWRAGHEKPYLELWRTAAGVETLSIGGLHEVKRGLHEAVAELLHGLPLLRRLAAAGGRPPGPPLGAEEAVRRAEDLKRQYPRLSWPQIAGRLGVPERSLARWRARFAS